MGVKTSSIPGTHQVPLQVSTHLPLHLVHLLEGEHLLSDDAPTLVGVGVIADDLAGDHECRDEQSVAGRSSCRGVSGLEALQQEQTDEGDEVRQSRSVESILEEVEESVRYLRIGYETKCR